MKSLFSVVFCALAMLALAQAARAGDAPPAPMGPYHVTGYVEVVPTATTQTVALMRAYRDAARKEAGATMVELYQELGMPSRFVTREVWRDAQAADAHAKAASTSDLMTKLKPIQYGPTDFRAHTVHFETPTARGAAAGSVVIVSHLDVTPNGLPQLIELMKGLGDGTAKEQGVATYQILRQTGGARNHFRLFEIWASEKDWEAHNLAKHTQDFRDGLAPLLGTPYDQRKYALVN